MPLSATEVEEVNCFKIFLGSGPGHRAAQPDAELGDSGDEVAPAVLLAEGQDGPWLLNESQERVPARGSCPFNIRRASKAEI